MVRVGKVLFTLALLTGLCFNVNTCKMIHELETELQRHILDKYDANVAPLENDESMDVNVSLSLLRIRNFNEVEEILQTNGLFLISWTDLRLRWNRTRFGNLSNTVVKQKMVWIPQISVVNTADQEQPVGSPEMRLAVDFTGLVRWEPVMFMDTICTMDTRYFPFDEQTCTIDLAPGHLPSHRIRLVDGGFNAIGNIHWKVTSHEVKMRPKTCLWCSCAPFRYRFTIKRRCHYYVTTLLLPIIAVSVLTAFSFLLPRDSGDKLSYSITIFLAYMVLMPFITERLPRTSEVQPLLISHISLMLMFAMVSVIWSVVSAFAGQCWLRNKRSKTYSEHTVAFVDSKAPGSPSRPCGLSRAGDQPPEQLHDDVNVVKNDFQQDVKSIHGEYEQLMKALGEDRGQGRESDIPSKSERSTIVVDEAHLIDTKVKSKYIFCLSQSLERLLKNLDLGMFVIMGLSITILTLKMMLALINNPGSSAPRRVPLDD